MASRHQFRSVTAVTESLNRREQILALDRPSDDEIDNEEAFTESEEDADDPEFEKNFAAGDQEESDNENAGPSVSKRGRLVSRPASMARRGRRRNVLCGKDGHRWDTTPQEKLSNRIESVKTYLPGPTGEAKTVRSPLEAWSLLFSDALLEKVVLHTNEEIHRWRAETESVTVSSATYVDTNLCEFKALIGLLYFSGLQKTSNTNIEDLWSVEFGSTLYRCTMSMKRFQFLLRMIRFDDKSTRAVRRETDKFAPIREVWEDFISKCTRYYSPASYCTIDEQLLSFRGRCPFKVYSGAKPDKYGMKIVILNDSQTFYMYTAEPYVGTVKKENAESVPSYYIRKLSEPLHGSGRNITFNSTKGGTDCFDHMCHEYTTSRKTLRWPLRFWFGMLDQGGINSMTLHNFCSANENFSRRDFLKQLIKGLVEPHLRVRLANPKIRRDVRISIETVLEEQAPPPRSALTAKKKARCILCPRVADRKTKTFCEWCHRAVCEEHRAILCSMCASVD